MAHNIRIGGGSWKYRADKRIPILLNHQRAANGSVSDGGRIQGNWNDVQDLNMFSTSHQNHGSLRMYLVNVISNKQRWIRPQESRDSRLLVSRNENANRLFRKSFLVNLDIVQKIITVQDITAVADTRESVTF